jgi:hypothetical protein
MTKAHLKLVPPSIENRTVPPTRLPNAAMRIHLDLKMKNAGQAPGEGWRVGRQTALLT